jgi:hypothetical protein
MQSRPQRKSQGIEEFAGAPFPRSGIVIAIQEGTLLGHRQMRAATGCRTELDGGEGDGQLPGVHEHVVAVENALLGNDVVIDRIEDGLGPIGPLAPQQLCTTAPVADCWVEALDMRTP